MKKNLFHILLFLTITIAVFPRAGNGQIVIADTISGILQDTIYIVADTLFVLDSDSLIIQPGAILLFNFMTSIEIYGYFYAVGTEQDSIIFCSSAEEIEWATVNFRNHGLHSGEMGFCHLSQASKSAVNVLYGADLYIHHCTVENNHANWGGGIYVSNSAPLIEDCIVKDNWSVNNGGGIYNTISNTTISNCQIFDNLSDNGGGGSGQGGGGICANHQSSVTITNCTIYNNDTFGRGGGIVCNDLSHANIYRCLIYNNHAAKQGGGLIIIGSSPLVQNCTFYNNSADSSASGICLLYAFVPEITNCLVYNNNDVGIGIMQTAEPIIHYSDIFGNIGGEITFDTVTVLNFGVITTVNANGDSCDEFYNIFLEPLLQNPLNANFSLTENSPCIDAGNPLSPFDPDGTVSDIGRFYFLQSAQYIIHDLVIIIEGDDVLLSWADVPNAQVYHIYRSDTAYFEISGMTPLADSETSDYTDFGAGTQEKWYYIVSWE